MQAVVEKGDEVLLYKGDELMVDITISNQLICQPPPPRKEPRALVVEAKLLDKDNLSKKNPDLPLRSYMDESLNTVEQKTEATPNVISGLESSVSK